VITLVNETNFSGVSDPSINASGVVTFFGLQLSSGLFGIFKTAGSHQAGPVRLNCLRSTLARA